MHRDSFFISKCVNINILKTEIRYATILCLISVFFGKSIISVSGVFCVPKSTESHTNSLIYPVIAGLFTFFLPRFFPVLHHFYTTEIKGTRHLYLKFDKNVFKKQGLSGCYLILMGSCFIIANTSEQGEAVGSPLPTRFVPLRSYPVRGVLFFSSRGVLSSSQIQRSVIHYNSLKKGIRLQSTPSDFLNPYPPFPTG